MKAYVFPGQGSQFPGMGQELYQNPQAKELFDNANQILGFDISKVMFEGTKEELTQTNVTQPAIFIHSVILALTQDKFSPEVVAGHSLGEFSALVANKTLSFEDGLKLVSARASAMQKACELEAGTMAAVLGLEDTQVEEICHQIDEVVVPANYNCPGQLVISGSLKGVEIACEQLKEAGARRALVLPVGGAFHSPLMEPARQELAQAIDQINFQNPQCAVVQNVDAQPHTDVQEIKENLIAQLTAPVRWTQSVQQMVTMGAREFTETGPGKVLQGLIRKIDNSTEVKGIAD